MWRVIFFVVAFLVGFWFAQPAKSEKLIDLDVNPEKDFVVTEHKSFVIVLYAQNEFFWCEKSLSSIFEQDYDHYRVIVIDDGSIDQTYERVQQFTLKNNQSEKVILMRNEKILGPVACLHRAIDSCLDREIIIFLKARDWLSSSFSLTRLNFAYQNPDVWLTFGKTIRYPSYKIEEDSKASFYAGLFKILKLDHFYQKGHFTTDLNSYLLPLLDLAGKRVKYLKDPLTFTNDALWQKDGLKKNGDSKGIDQM